MKGFKLLDEDKLRLEHYWFGFCWTAATIAMDYVEINLALVGEAGEKPAWYWPTFTFANVLAFLCMYYMLKGGLRWIGELRREMRGKNVDVIEFIKNFLQNVVKRNKNPVDEKAKGTFQYKLKQLLIKVIFWVLVIAGGAYLVVGEVTLRDILFLLSIIIVTWYRYQDWL